MTRTTRVFIELFAPPLLGSSPFLFMAIITGSVVLIPVVLLVAYVAAIMPSMIFTGLMELAFWRGLDPRSPGASYLAAFLGLSAGVAMGLVAGGPSAEEHTSALGLIGMLVGAATGLIVRWKSAQPAAEASPPPSPSTP